MRDPSLDQVHENDTILEKIHKGTGKEIPASPIQKPANIYSLPITQALKVIDIEAMKRLDAMKDALQIFANKQKGPRFKNPKKIEDIMLLKHCILLFSTWAVERAKVFNYKKYNEITLRSDEAIVFYHEAIEENVILVVKLQTILDLRTLAQRVAMHIRSTVIANMQYIRKDPRSIPSSEQDVRKFKKFVTRCCDRLISGRAVSEESYKSSAISLATLFGTPNTNEVINIIKAMSSEQDPREKFVESGGYMDIPPLKFVKPDDVDPPPPEQTAG
jgi:hypothetical protein